ncbi:hypothetical protein LCL97_16235 [Seohaeicola saemankumensis]|nr:hypothetical protein [Seohaeicola saemankumensis]MCA0872384.1 hypothetical protein [Seohaeicola saemankumensis]
MIESIQKALRVSALAVMMAPVAALADMPVAYKDGAATLFRFNAPDFWTVRAGGPRDLTAPGDTGELGVNRVIGLQPTADPHVWMGFVSPRGVSSFEQAGAYLREVGPFLVKNVSAGEIVPTRVGGLPARKMAGTGTRNGRAVEFTAVAIDLPGPRMAVSVVVFESGANPELVQDVNAVFASFRAAQ